MSFIDKIKQEIASYGRLERIFIFAAMVVGFCISAEHALTKPTSYAAFITMFSAKELPVAWLFMIPLNMLAVFIYNRFLSFLGCMRMLLITTCFSMSVNLISGYFLNAYSGLAFFLFIWKDISVLLFFQQLWSVIHATIRTNKAQYLYGIIFGVGGLGAIVGSLVPSLFAIQVGSANLLFFTMPAYILILTGYRWLLSARENLAQSGVSLHDITMTRQKTAGGIQLIRKSKYLQFILLIVLLMQIGTTLVEYQMNTYLQNIVSGQDLRTQYYGRLFALINIINTSFQFVGTFLLVHFIGLKKSHFLIPMLLVCNAIGFVFFPVFEMIAVSFVTIKSFDYSVFNIIKEMLYIPLKVEEKFKAKAIIDVFAYRTAKGIASLFVLGLQIYVGAPKIVSIFTCFIFISWSLACLILFKTPQEGKRPL